MTALKELNKIKLPKCWKKMLAEEFQKKYLLHLKQFLLAEKSAGKIIFPAPQDYFNAFNLTPFDKVKVVIIGQDPYHGTGQAHGLCFSVKAGNALPPSLVNIFKELVSDLKIPSPTQGDLTNWAKEGVFLLNTCLTVEANRALAHQGQGWELFTDRAILALNEHKKNLVFLLWGAHAGQKGQLINPQKHLVLRAAHPSPLSAYRGFFGCKHFSKTNEYLSQHNSAPIRWDLINESSVTCSSS